MQVCQTFAGTPELLGINIINEPFAGNVYEEHLQDKTKQSSKQSFLRFSAIGSAFSWWQDPSLLLPHVADRKRLQPAYDVVAGHIREPCQQSLPGSETTTSSVKIVSELNGTYTNTSIVFLVATDETHSVILKMQRLPPSATATSQQQQQEQEEELGWSQNT